MGNQAGSIVTSVLLALTFGCWLTTLLTPGWFLFEFKMSLSLSSLTNALLGESPIKKNGFLGQSYEKNFTITAEFEMGLFFMNVCINDNCQKIDFKDPKSLPSHQGMQLIEFQTESVLALILSTLSSILVMIPARSKSSQYRVALILMSIAVILESILIYRTASENKKIPETWEVAKEMLPDHFAVSSIEMKFPYSILIAGIGALLGILVWLWHVQEVT